MRYPSKLLPRAQNWDSNFHNWTKTTYSLSPCPVFLSSPFLLLLLLLLLFSFPTSLYNPGLLSPSLPPR